MESESLRELWKTDERGESKRRERGRCRRLRGYKRSNRREKEN